VVLVLFAALSVGAGAVVALLAAVGGMNPFATTTTEQDDAVVLAELRDLERFEAATGRFTTTIDQDEDADLMPDVLLGERVVFQAEGDVDASIDLRGLDEGDIDVAEDGTVTIHLPPPTLEAPRIDTATSRVVSRERGILNRLGDAVTNGEPTDDQPLYDRASEKLAEAATRSDLEERAEGNARTFFTGLLGEVGHQDVIVVFDAPSAAAAA